MRVDDNFSPSGVSPSSDLRSRPVTPTPETRAPGQPGEPKTAGATDSASLSALSVELSRAIQQEPPETVARIGRLQEVVSNGTYAVPASEVSAKIVASALNGL